MPLLIGYPEPEELRDRITRQLARRPSSEADALIWRGYLAGIFEWGLIDVGMYDDLSALLPKVGSKELYELFSGEPLTAEQEREIDQYLQLSGVASALSPKL